jgi:ParB-like chromosome segregation protein Spo0J
MRFHAVANIYPLLQGVEFESLCNSIKANGLRHPIITLDGQILDGRSRYRACRAVSVEPTFQEYTGSTELLDLLAFVRDENEERRHLSKGQLAAVAVSARELVDRLTADAKERMNAGKADPEEKIPQGRSPQVRDQLAEMFGTNPRYVQDAKKLKEKDPRVFEQVLAGNLTLQKAREVAGLKPFNYKRDSKHAVEQDIYTPQGMDACQTPAYALDPLLPYLAKFSDIWEPAAGDGLIVKALSGNGWNVIGSDLLQAENFFEYQPERWDCLVTNPPYSIKLKWIDRCYQLGKPFALLMPVETLGSKNAQEMFEKFGMELIVLNRRVNFKMPVKGWDAAGAQFSTAWFTWKLELPSQIVYGRIEHD